LFVHYAHFMPQQTLPCGKVRADLVTIAMA